MNIVIALLILIICASWYLAIGLYKQVRQYQAKLMLAQVTVDTLTETCNKQFDEIQTKNTEMLALLKALPKNNHVSDYLLK
jgi:hypothetical protein